MMHSTDIFQRMARAIPVFRELTPRQTKRLHDACESRKYQAEEVLCYDGDTSNVMWILMSGEVEVWKGGILVTKVEPIDVIGEIGVITGETRSASLVCSRDSEFLCITKSAFDKLMAQDAEMAARIYRNIVETVSHRLGNANIHMVDLIRSSMDLKQERDRLTRSYMKTLKMAITDPLTGLYNRSYFQEQLSKEVVRSLTYQEALSCVMIDVDHFKHYNDSYGHPEGDKVLIQIADLLRSSTRRVDTAARYGGEEFVLLLPHAYKPVGTAVAERFRESIENHPFTNRHTQPGGKLTVSIGVATCPDEAKDEETLVRKADQRLYLAKERGRNRVVNNG